ncbi:Lipocalin/cytosolic fatty-acid binding domain [Trinorchestia longiramus]|nr:Lipocalin/cytosolic fatty-acid binding domain [Trinorchestia longiramus]
MLCLKVLIFAITWMHPATAGICPSYPIIRDFDFSKYTGLWYHQDKQQTSWGSPGRCWQSIYVRDGKSGEYRMKLRYQNTITGRSGLLESTLTLQGPRKPSVIKYSIPYTFMTDEFQILATDYDSYSIEYQCHTNSILPKTENVFLLTRDKTPRAEVLQKAYSIMHRYGIDLRKLERVDQTCGGLSLEGVLRPEEMIAVQPWGDPVRETLPLLEQNKGVVYMGGNQVYDAGTVEAVRRRDQHVSASHISSPLRRRRQQPMRWSDDAQRRVSLGQSLATRLWHVLHTPFK